MLLSQERLITVLISIGTSLTFGTGLLAFSRATVGHTGLGSVTMLLPPVMLFMIGCFIARSTGSFRFGVNAGISVAIALLVATALVFGMEAAHWFEVAHVSILDGEYLNTNADSAAVLDALHPVILLVHLLFWLPWAAFGADAGMRARKRRTVSRSVSS